MNENTRTLSSSPKTTCREADATKLRAKSVPGIKPFSCQLKN